MPGPEKSKRLQIIDRMVTVLKEIVAGDDYFYTPHDAVRGPLDESAIVGYPTYGVKAVSGGEITGYLDQQNSEVFIVAVWGKVHSVGDVTTVLENAIRDIRKAINDDFKPGGGLISLAADVRVETPPDIDYEFTDQGFFALFIQRYRIETFGEWGEI